MIEQLRLVEIELFSYCNRKCAWCPNHFVDRTNFIGMEQNIFYKILEELRDNHYEGALTFSRYNEPMSHIDLLKDRLFEIKKYLPNNKLITNTNGDFLSKENLHRLLIDELTVMDYDEKGISWCAKRLTDCGATIYKIIDNYIYAKLGNMDILYFVDWQTNRVITDRGGTLPQFSINKRVNPCFEPQFFVGVNYDGTISPCCNIRNDIPELKQYILGDLHKNTLEQILKSDKAWFLRMSCKEALFQPNSPCYMCDNSGGRYTRGKGGISYV